MATFQIQEGTANALATGRGLDLKVETLPKKSVYSNVKFQEF
jgi:hypothetical protein